MTFADLLPVRFGFLDRSARPGQTARKHRAIDEVERQRILRAGADLLIKGLRLQLEEQAGKHADAIARIDARHAETVRGLEQQVADLERRLRVACQANAAADQTQEIDPEIVRRICVQPLYEAPFATTDPGRIRPSWARTQ